MASNQLLMAFTNCGSREEADRIAHWLVEQELAACVNILPAVQSVYRWQGKLEQAEEVTLLIKTSARQLETIKTVLPEQHSYELPELCAVEIRDGLPAYLNWVHENLSDDITP